MDKDKFLDNIDKIINEEEALYLTDKEELDIEIPRKIRMMISDAKRKQEILDSKSSSLIDKISNIIIPDESSTTISFGSEGEDEKEVDDPIEDELL